MQIIAALSVCNKGGGGRTLCQTDASLMYSQNMAEYIVAFCAGGIHTARSTVSEARGDL
jgi:hypothetical protein